MVKHIEINVVSTIVYVCMRLMFMYNDMQANVYVTLLEIQRILSLCHAFVFYYHVWIRLRNLSTQINKVQLLH